MIVHLPAFCRACHPIAREPCAFMRTCDMRLEDRAALCLRICAVLHVAVSAWIATARKTGSVDCAPVAVHRARRLVCSDSESVSEACER
eukprot:1978231-Prymnesium_polylepis.2